MYSALLVGVIAVLCNTHALVLPTHQYEPAPRYTVNLDESPSTRWVEIIKANSASFPAIQEFLNEILPAPVRKLLEPVINDIETLAPTEYVEEMKSIAANSILSLEEVVGLNFVYDLSAWCTSIVAQNSVTQKIYHARNLDYPLTFLNNITAQVDFQRGNTTVYSGSVFVGYVGLLTAMKPNVVAVTVDQRSDNATIVDNILEMLRHGNSIGFTIRDTVASAKTFDDALERLQHVRLIAPVYLITSGVLPGEGAVITRGREGPVDVWTLRPPQRWMVLETNYDHWLPPPAHDDRRDPAYKMMNAIGSAAVNTTALFSVLSTPPIFNHGTKYTTLISTSEGLIQTFKPVRQEQTGPTHTETEMAEER